MNAESATVKGQHVLVDPSLTLKPKIFERIVRTTQDSETRLFVPSILKPGSSVYQRAEWETFCRSFGLGSRFPKQEAVLHSIESSAVPFFSLEDARLDAQPHVDADALQLVARQGSFAQVEAEEIGFLLTHSTIAAATKERENSLFRRWTELKAPGRHILHVTVQGYDGRLQQVPVDIGRVVPWFIWFLGGASVAATATGVLPLAAEIATWLVNGGVLVSFQWSKADSR